MSKKPTEFFVKVPIVVLESVAWRHAPRGSHDLWLALRQQIRFDEANNGQVFISGRDAADKIVAHRDRIAAWLQALEDRGLIAMTEPARRGSDGKGRAARWRFTDVPYKGQEPTREFLAWRESGPGKGAIRTRPLKEGHDQAPKRGPYAWPLKEGHTSQALETGPDIDLANHLALSASLDSTAPQPQPQSAGRDWLTPSSSGWVH
jgi:hypothetical protein